MDKLATITHEPLRFSRNPLEINIDALDVSIENRVGIRYQLEIFVPKYFQSNEYKSLATQEASEEPPTELGDATVFPGATFTIEEIIDGLLEYKRPSFGQNKISVCSSQTISYYADYNASNGTITELGALPSEWVIKAAINEKYFEEWKDTFWTKYIGGNNRRFLTFQANNKKISPSEPEFLYFLTNFSPLPTQLCLRLSLRYEDGSYSDDPITVMSISGVTAYTVYCFPVGPEALKLVEIPEVIVGYDVWVSDGSNKRLSEVRSFEIDTDFYRNIKYIIYNNSLGGYDTVRLTGQSKESMNVERQTFERQTGFNHAPTFAERIVNRVTGERQITINTGWMSKDNFLACQDLLFANDVLLVTDREFIPLLNISNTLDFVADDEKLIGRELVFSYANRERSVSPLPIAPAQAVRPTAWRPYSFGGCQLDADGIRNGKQAVAMLEKYYVDNNASVKPAVIKPNTPDTEGYLPPQITGSCAASTTPFRSVEISRVGSYYRNNCPAGQSGSKAMVVVPANAYGSELSQADTDAKAESRWKILDTQEYVNDPANGATCSTAPELYTVAGVPNGRFNYRWFDKTGANANAMIQGGAGASNGDNTALAYGNSWPIAQNTNGGSLIYPQNSNDITLPINPGTSYQIFVIGWDASKACKVYYNGAIIIDIVITPADFQAFGGAYQVLLNGTNIPVPNQAMVYCVVQIL